MTYAIILAAYLPIIGMFAISMGKVIRAKIHRIRTKTTSKG